MLLCEPNTNIYTLHLNNEEIELKHPICFGKVYDRWLVSKCGKVWSKKYNKLIKGARSYVDNKNGKRFVFIKHSLSVNEADWWGDGSGKRHHDGYHWQRDIKAHKMIIDTWAPLYDNPPEGIVWEEWKIVRDLPSVYDHISKTVVIDHIDDDPANNHIDNLRRVTQWDNQTTRKAKGI